MKELQKIIDICNAYKMEEFGIQEFQHQLELVFLPDMCKRTLEIAQHNAFNKLDVIFYFYPEDEHKQHADKVADELIQAALAEQVRLKDYRPYEKK